MELLLIALAAGFVGYMVGAATTVLKLKRLLDEAVTDAPNIKNLKKQEIAILNTEKHGDTLYLFEEETDNFMCQGSTLEDLAKKLADYKDIHIALVNHNSKPIWFINGEVTEHPYES